MYRTPQFTAASSLSQNFITYSEYIRHFIAPITHYQGAVIFMVGSGGKLGMAAPKSTDTQYKKQLDIIFLR